MGFVSHRFLVTTGVSDGAAIYKMGLSGCLCAAGFYCANGQQCVVTPAGTYAAAWATAATPCPSDTAGSVLGAGSFAEGCSRCQALGPRMTCLSTGCTTCVAACASGLAWSAIDNACIPGCNTTRNLYRQDAAIGGGCVLCPPGTQSNGGVGLVRDSCSPQSHSFA